MATPQTNTAASSASNTSMMSMVGTTAAGSVGPNVLSSASVGIPTTTTSAASTGVLGTTGSNMSGGFTFSSVMTGGQATIPLPVVMGSQSSMASVSATAIPSFTTLPGTGMAHSYGYGFPTGMYGSGAIGTHVSRPVGGGGGGIKDISNKPPVMKSSFDLYAVQLKTYLTRLGLWNLIDGTEIRPLYDVNLQADFDARDNSAREAVLRGVPEVDAELICHEVSAKDIWVLSENKQTKREYANYIFAREQLYSSKYNRDLEMTDWLRDIQLKRRELSHYGKVISDEEFTEILLANVTRTHRDVVRQFSRHYGALALPGTQLMPPTSAQVMNALLAEEALDENVADAPGAIGSTSKQKTNSGAESGGNSKKKRRGRYKAKQKNKDENPGKTKKVVCWKCGEQGHIRPNCPNVKSDDNSQNQKQKQSAGMEAKRWQNKQGGEGKGGKKSVDALTVRKIGATAVGTRSRKSGMTEWVLDTATDVHVCTDMSLLDNPQRDNEHLFLDFDGQPKGERLVGDVRIIVTNLNGNQEEVLTLIGTVRTPTGPDNLLSSHLLEENGWKMTFERENRKICCYLMKNAAKLRLEKTRGRYRLQARFSGDREVHIISQAAKRNTRALERWHLRYAHLNYPALRQTISHDTATGFEGLDSDNTEEPTDKCWTYRASKLKRMSYKKTITRRTTECYQKLMSDMCYVGVESHNGYKHFQLIQDEATRYVWGFLMKAKEEATTVAMSHVKWLLAQGHRVEVFSCDRGKEQLNKRMKAFLRAEGVEFLWTNAYSPEENGLVEKMNGILLSRVRSLLTTANMPDLLWGEAFTFAVEVVNVSPSRGLDGDTPYARRFGEKPYVGIMRVWGCVVHEFTPKVLRTNKLENPGKLGLFLGFAKNSEGFRILNLRNGDINERRSVEFDESWTVECSYVEHLLANRYQRRHYSLPDVIPLVRLPVMAAVTRHELAAPSAKRQRLANAHGSGQLSGVVEQSPVSAGNPATEPSSLSPARVPLADAQLSLIDVPQRNVEYFEYDQLHDGGSDLEEVLGEPNSLSTPQRELRDSVEVQNAEDEDVEEEIECVIASGEPRERYLSSVGGNESESEHGSDSNYRDVFEEDSDEELGAGESFRRSSRIRRPNVRMKDYELELPESLVIQSMHAVMDPVSVQAALDAPDAEQWIEALNKEYSEMLRNNTWERVEKPEGVKVLTSRWVFVRKRNAQGQVERHRARITIRGCQQKYGLDFWETYAPVVCMEAVRLILLLALHYNLECRHIDFVTAFLNGPIDAEIYMKQPEFFNDGTGRVCKLLRSLYGLKQAPRMWYQTLDKYLKECGFKRSKMDGGIYYRWVDSGPIFLTLYVDDIVIAASAENTKLVLTELANKFQVKDLGNVNHLLSMEIKYIPGLSLTVSQRGYIGRILERFKMDKCKPMPTPQAKGNLPLPGDPDREVVCVNSNPDMDYQCIVGSLQYLVSCSRPDIANAVRTLGKFLTCFTKEHEVMAKRVLRYLQGTRDYGLVWIKPMPRGIRLVAYADADLGNEKDDRLSLATFFSSIAALSPTKV